ncbi:ABC transporter substrate-binding protein [Brachybacterium fresconis]|uniref:Sn-glycerol 3-phosphate transport system substrate-binding protein n=1 Tax=Brachybacterium fresconis TaxID=173363 RepID=A0ABS4YMP0_9MICO|nr:ABC transporter substrate-binding protein [Brachybacterium fresconis]MBP2410064.1 sn-glycerol 3-phosphate transport system substrate-binding protein [Brachybacterium fresconis]
MALTRRSLLGMAGAGSAALALGACAGGSTSAGGGGGEEGDGTLQFWSNHPGSSKDIEQAIIDAWNEENPDTPAKLIDGGASYEELGQKFNAALAGGGLPDLIVASDVTWFNFAFTGATTALDDLWEEAGVDSDDLVDTLREDYAYDGKHYGMPFSRSTTLMYFNTEVMKSAGLPTDRGPETWDEFAQWAPKIMDANDGKPAVVVPDGSDYLDWYFQGMIWTFDGAYSEEWTPTFTEQGSIDAATFLQEQVAAGHIKIEKDATNSFAINNASGLLQSTGSLGGLNDSAEFDFHTTYLPGPTPGACTGGAGVAIPDGISDERKVTAMKFADFLTSTKNTITFSQATGYMPVRKSAMEDEEEKTYLEENPNAMTAIRQLSENTAPQDYARVFVSGGGQRIGAGLDRIAIAGEDVSAVMEDLQKETQEVIDRDITPNL